MTDCNFMLADLIGTAVGFCLFPLFVVVPGYVCGWFVDALGFRDRSLVARFAISVPLSIGISPVLAYLLWHWSLLAVWAGFGCIWVAFLVLLIEERDVWLSKPTLSKAQVGFALIVAAWIALGTVSLIDFQFKDRLYFPVIAYDYTLRTAITAAITKSGIPPHNPYFFPGQPVFLRYHYFWFILSSLVNQIGRTGPRLAMLAGTLWSGIGLIALIPLYLRFFQPKGRIDLERRILIGVGLLSIAGLSIVPVAILDVFAHSLFSTDTAVAPWISEVLWAPHHVAALIACLTALLLLSCPRDGANTFRDSRTSLVAGIAFASGVGLSVYVAFVFAVFLAVWLTAAIIRRLFAETASICLAGIVACTASAPYILELVGRQSGQKVSGGPFLQFAIRVFPISDGLISQFRVLEGWPLPVLNASLLPLNYLLALGFFFVVGFLQWGRMRTSGNFLDHSEAVSSVLATTSIVLCTFLRSGVIASNDLGKRGIMLAQFMLLLWGAELLAEISLSRTVHGSSEPSLQIRLGANGRKLLGAMLMIGVAGTINDLYVLRFLPIVADLGAVPMPKWLSLDHNLGKRTFALRDLYENLKQKIPESAVVQHNPDTDPGDVPFGLYADRQLAAETLGCGTVFGGDAGSCAHIIRPIRDLFETPRAADALKINKICTDLSINALIAKDTDPVWTDKNSWVWRTRPLLANAYARAYLCGP